MISLFSDIEGIECGLEDGVKVIRITKTLSSPVFIDLESSKLKIIIEDDVEVSLLERETKVVDNEYILKRNAKLNHNLISLENSQTSHRVLHLQQNAFWQATSADLGDDSAVNIDCFLDEEQAKGQFKLSAVSRINQKKEFNINFIHSVGNTTSSMENYGVAKDEGTLLFLGTSHIKNGAKKSKANQVAKIMVFDPKCKASTSPILRIDENDVSASHAAVEGKINDDHLYYLMSRGIKQEDAKRLITLGYLNPVLPYFFDEETKNIVEHTILEKV